MSFPSGGISKLWEIQVKNDPSTIFLYRGFASLFYYQDLPTTPPPFDAPSGQLWQLQNPSPPRLQTICDFSKYDFTAILNGVFDAGRNLIYLNLFKAGYIWIIDVSTGTPCPIGFMPQFSSTPGVLCDACLSSSGRYLYVSLSNGGSGALSFLKVVDLINIRTEFAAPVVNSQSFTVANQGGFTALRLRPDGNSLAICDAAGGLSGNPAAGSLLLFDTSGSNEAAPVLKYNGVLFNQNNVSVQDALTCAYSADGDTLYVIEGEANWYYEVDVSSLTAPSVTNNQSMSAYFSEQSTDSGSMGAIFVSGTKLWIGGYQSLQSFESSGGTLSQIASVSCTGFIQNLGLPAFDSVNNVLYTISTEYIGPDVGDYYGYMQGWQLS